MHIVTVVFGITLLVLIGVAVVLGLVVLVLYEVRWIVRTTREVSGREQPPSPYFSDDKAAMQA